VRDDYKRDLVRFLEALQSLPPTVELEAEIEKPMPSYWSDNVRQSQSKERLRRLEAGKQRDAIKAARPEECFCLGLGGTGAIWMQYSDFYRCERLCSCPDGARVVAEYAAEQDRLHAEARAARVTNLLLASQLPERVRPFTFDGYPVSSATRAELARIRGWSVSTEGKKSLFLHGPTGTGKTGLAAPAFKQLIADCDGGVYWTHKGFMTRVHQCIKAAASARRRDSESTEMDPDDFIDDVQNAPALVLDELGAGSSVNPERPFAEETLFDVINFRYDEGLPTIFVSNFSLDELVQRIGERTVWRIVEMSEVVHLDGPNLRDPNVLAALEVASAAVDEAQAIANANGRRR
jgi:DNA replication protein DnaC